MSTFSLNGSAPALKGVPDASWEAPKEPARVTKMIAAVLKKRIFFLLEQTGRWRGEEPRHPKPLTEAAVVAGRPREDHTLLQSGRLDWLRHITATDGPNTGTAASSNLDAFGRAASF